MPFLIGAVAFVGILCAIDLVLSFGIIRRLRTHTTFINGVLNGASEEFLMSAGQTVGAFTAVTDDGEPVCNETLRDRTLVGFFLEDCSGCVQGISDFTAAAARMPGGRDHVLAVVVAVSDEQKVAEYRARLAPTSRVILERQHGVVGNAFQVVGFPSFALLGGDGRVLATGSTALSAAAPARV